MRLSELDSLAEAAKKDICATLKKTLQAYLNAVKNADKINSNTLENAAEHTISSENNADSVVAAERLVATSFMLGIEHAGRDADDGKDIVAADDIPPIPFAEAEQFLRSKIPMTKSEWEALEPKVRFRAFTVARLTTADYIETAKNLLADAIESGAGYAETWRQVSAAVSVDPLSLRPGYWENVYRTNTQSAYIAGKLQGFADNPPAAIRLLVIDDSRTSQICRRLLAQNSSYGMTLPANHPFWTKYGYPPYHYQCRTGIQAVSASELSRKRIQPSNPSLAEIKRSGFTPQADFGGNPLDGESWWRMPKDMAVRAARYGIFNEVEAYAKQNGLHNFAIGLVDGSDWRNLQKTKFHAEKAKLSDPLQKEVEVARILTEHNHSVYFTPVNNAVQNQKNPDGIIDGMVADIKVLTSKKVNKIEDRIKECERQKVRIACICTPDEPGYTRQEAAKAARRILNFGYVSGEKRIPLQYVKSVYLIYGGTVSVLKK